MLFDSAIFFVFLAIVVTAYWSLRHRAQNRFLLVASYIFYGWWDWRFLGLMAGSTTIDYVIARRIAATENPAARKRLLVFSLVVNFAVLGLFKYFNFFVDSFVGVLHTFGVREVSAPVLRVLLPPGISFYTFQEVAYIVDVYKKRLPPADSLIDYALFISLFPHLIAGPIQRPSHLLPQVQQPRRFDDHRFFDGVLLIFSGLIRKCVVADNCALLANAAFDGHLGPRSLAVVLIGAYAFAWQIYGDFSGYSNIARGAAQLLGFHFMVNFRQPYLAQSLQDFWRRWHISLSTWLRDYLYIPLGGNADGGRRTYRNLMFTMLLGGLWHGANLTFVVWGAIHGAGLAVERFFCGRVRDSIAPVAVWVRRVLIFQFVCLAWIFFRATSLADAIHFLGGIGHWSWQPELGTACQILLLFTIPLFFIDVFLERTREEYALQKRSLGLRTAAGLATLALIMLLAGNQANAFIYFQF